LSTHETHKNPLRLNRELNKRLDAEKFIFVNKKLFKPPILGNYKMVKEAIDPICKMKVDIEGAKKKNLVLSKKGKDYYFCSNTCKDKFDGKAESKVDGKSNNIETDGKSGSVPWYQSEGFGKMFPWFLGITLVLGTGLSIMYDFMLLYMGIFFIIFSLFKAIDWKGFIVAFKEYDLFAKFIPGYSTIYPALEFLIGVLFIVNFYSGDFYLMTVAWITLVIMVVGAIGVSIKLLKNEKFQCACLGTFIKVPLTKVTLLENILMAVMAVMLLFF